MGLSVRQADDTVACIGRDNRVTACLSFGRRENRWSFDRLRWLDFEEHRTLGL